ncbi:uncharacterized protein BXZ73DRAFT_93761 [Epithele typhae]|uniref:uncharacterized protein n=1 Tax=Epithele typhae TaxID=378194 RepID=UPI0020080191|nr:uncharacterized protein BXZ73DRAFT_93761 [Epithele typhae]KAH9910438.1 hypothetical protein BXZ73DRAFT_93761 [Epithele typhae]
MADDGWAGRSLQEATHRSTVHWQDDLQALFDHAKDRFADVVWELSSDNGKGVEEVWGHKAVVYARAPPSFQARYFSFKPPPAASPLPYSSSPTGTLPAQSSLSLTLGIDFSDPSRSPSPYRAPSPSHNSPPGALLRLPTSINPALFSNELEYLYTGKGLGQAFEFLFDSNEASEEGDGDDARLDKLRKDLVFMWRSRLYSDIRISLTGSFSSTNHESATAIFTSHRFILVSRCPYFNTQLLQWSTKSTPGEPFTTAFHIMRSASYLSLDTLYDEIQARIVQEMMHGLCHAFLEFSEYEATTGGKWGTGGCRCRQCARRAPRILEFAISDDVKNPHLERGARRALVGLFGEGWCISEFARSQQAHHSINVFPLLKAAHDALRKLDTVIDTWGESVRDMVLSARKTIDNVAATQAAECFEQPEWVTIMEADGVRFEDGEVVEMFLESLRRGLNDKNAAMAYQTIVDSVLLRPHPADPEAALLSSTSHVRVQVEQARKDIVQFLKKRFATIKHENGFSGLEPWAAGEIANELGVQDPADLTNPSAPSPPRGGRLTVRNGPVSNDSDTVNTHSTASRTTTATFPRRLTPALSRSSITDTNRARSPLSPSPGTLPRSSMSTATSSTTPERYPRPKSVAASVKSTRPAAGPSGLRTPSGSTRAPSRTPSRAPSRATSTVSTTSENTTAFETAPVGRVRKTSAASRAPGPSASRSPKRPPSDKPVDSRTASSTSVSSVKSTTTNATRKSAAKSTTPTPPLPKPAGETKANGKGPESATGEAGGTAKGKSARPAISHEKQESVVSTSSVSTGSTDTIREGAAAKVPRGDTLEIGIPCIISSKRTRFRALARYIGEVEGEVGPWVGVEVPMNDAWPGDKLDGRQWHDGTWGGVRYFDIGSSSENEWAGSSSKSSLGKREGDQLSIERSKRLRSVSPAVSDMSTSESRGLFVRPQQVLYVVDAVV